MVTKIKIFMMSILFLLSLIPAAAQQVTVNLKMPPPNQLGVADLWNLTLNNTSQNTLKVYLEGTVDEATDGRILEARSKEFELSPGIKLITSNDMSGANITYKNNKYKEIILRTGNAPPGNYNFCVYVKLESGIEAGSDCKSQSIMNLSPPALVSPADGVAITEIYPSFSWMPPSPVSPGQNISYSIKIVEMRSQESPEQAIKRSGFEANDLIRNFFQYPVSASGLEKGKSYAWQVTAFANGSAVGKSEIWKFSVEGVPIVKTQNFKDFLMVMSGIVLELDRTVYPQGTSISAKLYIDSGDVHIKNPAILYSAPQSKDVEAIKLVKTSNDSVYETERPLPIKPFTSDGDVKVNDGYLTLKPNEMFFGIYLPKDSADMGNHIGPDFVSDFGIMEDRNFRESPFKIIPELAMTDDETNIPASGKRIGTVTTYKGIPVQLPVEELIIYPRNEKQLRRFLQKTDGEIVMTSVDNDSSKPTSYLVRVHTDVRMQDFSQVRAVLQLTDTVYASNTAVLQIITLCIECMLDGYIVDVNPRLQFASSSGGNSEYRGAPKNPIADPKYDETLNANFTDTAFNIPRVWSYMALWDADEKQIPVAFIDYGFSYNEDFRGTRDGIIEFNMAGGSSLPRSAEGVPTVGNSFFGEKSWHGTGCVTTAGGTLDGKRGGGSGGQVVSPILININLWHYAFETGGAMKIATDKGANIINMSGGYPCTIVTNILGWRPGICSVSDRTLTCTILAVTLTKAVFEAAEITCATLGWLPFGIGPAICAAAKLAASITYWANLSLCLSQLFAGDLKSNMENGVNYAFSRGVTVVSISGNKMNDVPDILKPIVNTNNNSVDDWQIIPGVLPGVICVAACQPNAPYDNAHFFGNRVDIWAPQNTPYWAPSTTNKLEDPQFHVMQKNSHSATSSAVPYICGLIADMQALNDELNPKKVSQSEQIKIPGRIKKLLVDNAYKSGVELTASSERRNMVNPLKTLIAASPQVIQDFQNFSLKGYNTSLGYDELDASKRYDDETTALQTDFLNSLTYTGVVGLSDVSLPFYRRDVDWFKLAFPAPGVYGGAIVQVTVPNGSVSKFGQVKINGTLYPPLQNSITHDESTIEVKLPDMLSDCGDLPFKIEGYFNDDNVYKLKYIPGKRISDAPEPDRFDRVYNPFGNTDNNIKSHAIPLGKKVWVKSKGIPFETDEYNWKTVKQDKDNIYYEVSIADLNFHTCNDSDWFQITPPPGLTEICGHLMCSVPITVSCMKEGKPVNVLISVYDNTNNTIYEDILSTADIGCANPSNGYPLYIKLRGAGAPIKYDLNLSVNIPIDVKKYVDGCDEMWKWVITPKYPPIKLNQNWWCEWGTEPVLFGIDWTNNGGFNWSQGGLDFNMQGVVGHGSSISMQLFNSQGNLITQSSTQDFNAPNSEVEQNETFQGYSVLSLEQPNLQEGTYYLMLSSGTNQAGVQPNLPEGVYGTLPGGEQNRNSIQLLLPRNLLGTNSPSIEDFSGGQFSGNMSSGFILNPASSNQKLIFR